MGLLGIQASTEQYCLELWATFEAFFFMGIFNIVVTTM